MKTVATLAAGVSLVGIAGFLLYVLYKKDDEETRSPSNARRGTKIEVKIPKSFVGSLIGRCGSNVRCIEQQTDTKITFSEPDTKAEFNLCIIRGCRENAQQAESMIHEFLANIPDIKTKEFHVPQRIVGKIIGRCGERIHQIMTVSGAKIRVVDSELEKEERKVIIKGEFSFKFNINED